MRMKLLLIILLFCFPIIIIAADDQLSILLWPNEHCEILKNKVDKCENEEKQLTWLVRINSSVENYVTLSKEEQLDDFQCRNECFNASNCLTIQQNDTTCRKFSFADKFNNNDNTDVLQLACCNKQNDKDSVSDAAYDYKANQTDTYQCSPLLKRNDCRHFLVWFFQIVYNKSIGRDIAVYKTHGSIPCKNLCEQHASCVATEYFSDSTLCHMKYSTGFNEGHNQSNKITLSSIHCCKDPRPTSLLRLISVSQRIDIKYEKDKKKKCPIGWKKQWAEDTSLNCKINEAAVDLKFTFCFEDIAKNFCWEKNCSIITLEYGTFINRCHLHKITPDCSPHNKRLYQIFYLACVKEIHYEIQPPEVVSVFADCVFDKQGLIGYNGTISKSAKNKLCLHWTDSYFKQKDFPNKVNQHNYCRNINNDPKGPWCITFGHHHMEYCSIPKCEKAPIQNENFDTSSRKCVISKPKRCNAVTRQWVFVKRNDQSICPHVLITTERVSIEEYCFYACVLHPKCLFAFYNPNNHLCQLVDSVINCQYQDIGSKMNVAQLYCCLREFDDCSSKVPIWFIILLTISYLLLAFAFIAFIIVKIKFHSKYEYIKVPYFPKDKESRKFSLIDPSQFRSNIAFYNSDTALESRYAKSSVTSSDSIHN